MAIASHYVGSMISVHHTPLKSIETIAHTYKIMKNRAFGNLGNLGGVRTWQEDLAYINKRWGMSGRSDVGRSKASYIKHANNRMQESRPGPYQLVPSVNGGFFLSFKTDADEILWLLRQS
jgi:hypothetical protein